MFFIFLSKKKIPSQWRGLVLSPGYTASEEGGLTGLRGNKEDMVGGWGQNNSRLGASPFPIQSPWRRHLTGQIWWGHLAHSLGGLNHSIHSGYGLGPSPVVSEETIPERVEETETVKEASTQQKWGGLRVCISPWSLDIGLRGDRWSHGYW